jgi:hypothetical protein
MSDGVIPSKTYKAPEADYYEGTPEGFDVFSWSPSPPSTPLEHSKSTQVHLHGVVSFGRLFWRFKSPRTLDRLIAALIEHRVDVFREPWEPEMKAALGKVKR